MSTPHPRLAQYFTPEPIVDLAYGALRHFGAAPGRARVADPACGEGAWLAAALRHAPDARALGCDRDGQLREVWREVGLLGDERVELHIADGLLTRALPEGACDLVVGNPPFGITLADEPEATLRAVAGRYHLHRDSRRRLASPGREDLDRLRRFPLELLFLERFVTLCRPGGWVAIVLPEGVAANARWRRVREWLLACVTLRLVVALPRETFASHHTSARTCLTVMRKAPAPLGHRVTLAALDRCSQAACADLLAALDGPAQAHDLPAGLLPPPLARG